MGLVTDSSLPQNALSLIGSFLKSYFIITDVTHPIFPEKCVGDEFKNFWRSLRLIF